MGEALEADEIYVLDPDIESRARLARILRGEGFHPILFDSEMDLFRDCQPERPSCLIVSEELRVLTGSQIQCLLNTARWEAPLIFMSTSPTVEKAVQAMRAGAIDFLAKPVDAALLLASVRAAVTMTRWNRRKTLRRETLLGLFSELTDREREVLQHVVGGLLNKQTGAHLGVTEKTIKVHRSRIMQKLGLRTLPDLIRATNAAGLFTAAQKPGALATWSWDIVHDAVTGNQALEDIYRVQDTSGAPPIRAFIERLHPYDSEKVCASLKSAITSLGHYESHHRVIGDAGNERFVLSLARVIYDVVGSPIRLSGIAAELPCLQQPFREPLEQLATADDWSALDQPRHQFR